MLSRNLRQILPLKMPFFVSQKVQISSKLLPQIPNFANFVKFRQKSIFSSRRPVFVISSVFRQKRSSLESTNDPEALVIRWVWLCKYAAVNNWVFIFFLEFGRELVLRISVGRLVDVWRPSLGNSGACPWIFVLNTGRPHNVIFGLSWSDVVTTNFSDLFGLIPRIPGLLYGFFLCFSFFF